MRTKAYEVNAIKIPPLKIPEPHKLLDIKDVYSLSWQGSVGASSYILQRREAFQNDWRTISDGTVYAYAAYKPLFIDTTAEVGKEYYYRVLAQNESGISEPSNEVGPIRVSFYRIVDEFEDLSKIYSKDGIIEQIKFKEIYRVKEGNSRYAVNSGSSIIYEVLESISSFKVFAFARKSVCGITLFASDSLNNFIEFIIKLESFPPCKNVYGFLIPITLTCEEFPINTKYVKILFNEESQLGRTEIEYSLKSIK